MIKIKGKQALLEFGKGDISIAGGCIRPDKATGFVIFENQEPREVGSPGITKVGEVDLNDFEVVMTFSEKESINSLIYQLELTKRHMEED